MGSEVPLLARGGTTGRACGGCSRGNRLVLAYTATTRPIEPPDRRRPGGGDVAPCHRVRGMRRSRGQPAYTPHLRPCRCATLRRAAVHPPAVAADARPTIGLGLAEPIPAARRRCHGCGASAGSGRSESVGTLVGRPARYAQPVSCPPRGGRRTFAHDARIGIPTIGGGLAERGAGGVPGRTRLRTRLPWGSARRGAEGSDSVKRRDCDDPADPARGGRRPKLSRGTVTLTVGGPRGTGGWRWLGRQRRTGGSFGTWCCSVRNHAESAGEEQKAAGKRIGVRRPSAAGPSRAARGRRAPAAAAARSRSSARTMASSLVGHAPRSAASTGIRRPRTVVNFGAAR